MDASALPLRTCAQLARELTRHLASAQAGPDVQESLLDAYLCAAGMCQLLEDYLDRDATGLRRLGRAVGRSGVAWASPAAGAMAAAAAVADEARRPLKDRVAIARAAQLDPMIRVLADQLVRFTWGGEEGRLGGVVFDLFESSQRLERAVSSLPTAVRDDLARLPACFFSFDLKPEDCGALARRFAGAFPDRSTPLLVVGVRTSGSYLAPLTAAYLRQCGFRVVDTVSWRPGGRWSRQARRRIRSVLDAHGIAAVVDDPPITGESVSRSCEELVRLGFSPARVVPMVYAFATPARQPWRRRLAAYRPIVLPQRCWVSHRGLRSPAVEESLSAVLTGRSVTTSTERGRGPTIEVAGIRHVKRLRLAPDADPRKRRPPRGHLRAEFRVELVGEDGHSYPHLVHASGVGVGFFGRWPLLSAKRLASWVPEVYGANSGICFRACVPPTRGLVTLGGDLLEAAIEPVARYVAARQRSLSLRDDPTLRVLGRGTLWDRCGHLLGAAFGRAAVVAREGLRPHYRTLLGADRPSLIDGSMSPLNWFAVDEGSAEARLIKANHDEETFWSGTPFSQDAGFDLASAAVEFGAWGCLLGSTADFDSRLREAYVRETGDSVDPERWLLLKLLHLQTSRQRHFHDAVRARPGVQISSSGLHYALGPLEAEMSSCFQRYWAEVMFGRLPAAQRDNLCAIDIDGVLETPWLGFATLTPAGAAALWGLALHGHGVVLASGRSLEEVRERCRNYRLAGGVAEYGGAWYDGASATTGRLVTESQQADLDELRQSLRRVDAWLLPGFEHSVRACTTRGSRRSALSEEQIERALAGCAARERVRVIRGRQQTDFVPVGVDKAVGLRALLDRLQPRGHRHLVAAVGDTASDLPMLQLAAAPFAPANADEELRAAAPDAGIRVVDRPNQSGLALAVTALIGHRPGSCAVCRRPVLTERGEFLMWILAAQDAGRWGKVFRAFALNRRAGWRL